MGRGPVNISFSRVGPRECVIARTLERPGLVARPDRAHARISRSQWAEWVAGAAVVVGSAVRIEQFLFRRSLWLDEALVANNIVNRSYRGLLHALDGKQGAPIGWLWVQHTMVRLFGNSEYALRLVPLAGGIAALALVHWVARHVLGPWPAAVATWLLALSPEAVRYSVEVKQYSTDLAMSAALVFLALQSVETKVIDGRHDRRAIIGWGGLGAIALWWSHPAVFVIAGTAAMLALDALRRRGRQELLTVVRASVPWIVSFAIDWFVSLRRLHGDPFLRSFWAAGFPPQPISPSWLVRAPVHLLVDPGGIVYAGAGAVAVAVGLGFALRHQPVRAGMVVMPLAAGIGAACLHAYPLRGRLALWLLPVIIVGLAGLVRIDWRAIVVVALLAAAPAAAVFDVAKAPPTFQDSRPMLQALRRQFQPGDQLWVHAEDNAVLRFYRAPITAEVEDAPADACTGNPDLRAVAAGRRVWFVYDYHGSDAPLDEEPVLVAHLAAAGHYVERIHRPSATAYLFDFSRPPDGAPPPSGDIPCVTVTAA